MLGGDCSPCCVSCPDYWVLMQADNIVVSFSWLKHSTATVFLGNPVSWSAQWASSQTDLVISGGQFWGNQLGSVERNYETTVPMTFTLSEGTPDFNFGGPFFPRWGQRTVRVFLNSHFVPLSSGPQGSVRSTKGGRLGFVMGDTVSSIDYIGMHQQPCHNMFESDPCRMELFYVVGSSGYGPNGSLGVTAIATNNGETTLSSSWTPPPERASIKRLEYTLGNNASPQSLECSGNAGSIPETMTAGISFYARFESGGGVTEETLTVHSIEALFGTQRVNLLASAEEASWQIENALYINGIAQYPVP